MKRRALLRAGAAAAVSAVIAAGCAYAPRPVTRPMRTLVHKPGCAGGTLVLMLPGAGSVPEEFETAGFVDAMRQRGIAAEAVIADAHLGYYNDRSVIDELRRHVVLPARERGIRQVWLVGISLGGFGALGYAARHPGEVAGVFAIAPYLGRRTLQRDIVAAGGPVIWQRTAQPEGPDDLDTQVWRDLAAPRPGAPPVWLGFGADDRFAASHRLAASVLPAERVSTVPGGHDWPPWRALWVAWLARGLLPRCATGST
jgi:dienelactone hydrolase